MPLLSDTLIVDATDRFGWLAGRIQADLGADVIKLDPPEFARGRSDWRAFDANKRVVDLDPTTDDGRRALDMLLWQGASPLVSWGTTPDTARVADSSARALRVSFMQQPHYVGPCSRTTGAS